MSPSPSPTPGPPEAEFDRYAADYTAGMDNPIKQMMGSDERQFITPKVLWMLRDLARRPVPSAGGNAPGLLDFGCGTGLFLQELRRCGYTGQISGCDVSRGMLEAARGTWNEGSLPDLRHHLLAEPAPFPDESFDVVIVSSVLHHVEPADRPGLAGDLWRLLKRGGRLYVFEHNPWNPLTRWVVRRTPIDRHAVLISAAQTRRLMLDQGFGGPRVRYLLFCPPRLGVLTRVDGLLRWCPLGAQYAFIAEKTPASSGGRRR